MITLGDWYYYGHHGLPRDHPKALQLFSQAGVKNSTQGKIAEAAMRVKGEGCDKNVSLGLQRYEEALEIDPNSVRAMNGLGFLYFYGVEGELSPNMVNSLI